MTLVAYDIPIVTDGSGNCIAYSEQITNGVVVGLRYERTNGIEVSSTADITIVGERTRIVLWQTLSAGTSATYIPTAPIHNVVGIEQFGVFDLRTPIPIIDERIEVVVANGDASKEATITVLLNIDSYSFEEPEEE